MVKFYLGAKIIKKVVSLQPIIHIKYISKNYRIMANHKSQFKRIRQNEKRRIENRYWAKTMRNAVKKFRNTNDITEAKGKIPNVVSLIDKVAKKGIIHKNKAANLKSGLMIKINKMS